jgi:DNA-binding CsgD family transcriptional regulator
MTANLTGDAPKREEQVLVLAAGGLTDKEIAIRLGISPDTVGTYSRRISAKAQAASRTEVVAKYTEERARLATENLRYVNECLKLVNEHMIEHAVGTGSLTASLSDAILASLTDWVLLIDVQGTVIFSNTEVASGTPMRDLFQVEEGTLENCLAIAGAEPTDATLETSSTVGPELAGCYAFRFAPCLGESVGNVVACGRKA